MAKVFGVHEIALNQGASEQAFEQFVREEWMKLPAVAGWKFALLKGNRGDRTGRYLVLVEIESVEARDRLVPEDGVFAAELQRWLADTKVAWDTWTTFASGPIAPTFTDYVVVSESSR